MDGNYGSGMKRASDDGDDTDIKRARINGGQNPPSRVVHIRSLHERASETDVVQLGMPFGKMTNLLLMKQKNQAFLEFEDIASALNMVQYFKSTPAQVQLKTCYVQFSNHQELKTDSSNNVNTNAYAALQAAQGIVGPGGSTSSEGTTILRVIVDNVLYPVTLEVLHQLFSRFGKIVKIITFTKNNTFQALIQFSDSISASTAKDSLDNQNIYNGCNTLKIDFSRLAVLNVKYNNDKSRDFTRPDLPSGEGQPPNSSLPGLLDNNMGGNMGAGMMGDAPGSLSGMGNNGGFNFGSNNFNSNNLTPALASRLANLQNNSMGGMGNMQQQQNNQNCCILVSNLDEEKVTPDALFILFGVYGNVHRVKILFNKKDNALIQMQDGQQAQQAITYLDNASLWGKKLRVAKSKHSLIQMPRDGQSDAGLTKDFVNSPHHRFKRNNKSNANSYIFGPTSVLHLYNVNVLQEDDIRQLFCQYGLIKNFKFFPNERKMALIEFETIEEGTHALIGLHNYEVGENLNMRVSFSRSTI